MYLVRCVNAYTALQQLMEKEWDYATAHSLVLLKRGLQPHVDFFAAEEMKLANEYAEKDEKGKVKWSGRGTFRFKDEAAGPAYKQKREELAVVEVEPDWTVVKMREPESIKPVILEALEGFVEFGGEGT